MIWIQEFDTLTLDSKSGHPAKCVLTGSNGAAMGVTLVTANEYGYVGVHDDQEGFFVAEGHGFAAIGDQEIEIGPNSYILLPPHTKHAFKKSETVSMMKLFWFHAAAS